MDATFVGVVAIVVAALLFDFTNGFRDAADTIATSISTQALTPRAALGLAAVMNLLGALLGTGVAQTVGSEIIETPSGDRGLIVVAGAVIGAIIWNLLTWWLALPSSSSLALIGGLVGSALAASSGVQWAGILENVAIPMVLAPVVGFVGAYALMIAIMWMFRRAAAQPVNRGFRLSQAMSASAVALGHGLQDAQKTMGVVVLALVTAGYQDDFTVPIWVIVVVAATLSLGTYAGGWRIISTVGRRIARLDPPRGFAAETTAASVMYVTALVYAVPVSTTHTITSSVLGAGATRRLSAVRWGVAGNVMVAWVLTIPGAGLAAALTYQVLQLII